MARMRLGTHKMFRICLYVLVAMVATRAILRVTPHWFEYVVIVMCVVGFIVSTVRLRADRRDNRSASHYS